MIHIFFLLLMILYPGLHAQNALETLSIPCKSLVVQEATIILSSKKPVMIMVHNLSSNDLWITHSAPEKSAGVDLSSQIGPDKWSALVLTDKTFELKCIESQPGHEQQVPCFGLVAICELTKVSAPQKSKTSHWISENMELRALLENLSLSSSFTRTI